MSASVYTIFRLCILSISQHWPAFRGLPLFVILFVKLTIVGKDAPGFLDFTINSSMGVLDHCTYALFVSLSAIIPTGRV